MSKRDREVRTVEVTYLAKTLAQVQIAVARLNVALMKKADEEGVTKLPLPPPEFTGGEPPWLQLLETRRERRREHDEAGFARGFGDETCDEDPGFGGKGGPIDYTCDEDVAPPDGGEEDPLRDLCTNLGRLSRFLWWLCWILRYREV